MTQNDAFVWTALAAACGMWLIVALALVETFDRRRQRKHDREQQQMRLAVEQQRTAREWLRFGYCPACGAPAEDGPDITAALREVLDRMGDAPA